MQKRVLLLALLLICIAGTSNATRFNYTWKDASGNLFITDYPPPEGAVILDISAIPMPEVQQVIPEERENKIMQREEEARKMILAEAEDLRKQAKAKRQKALELRDEAREQLRLAKLNRYDERYRRRASNREEEAKDLEEQADSLVKKAEELERQATTLK